VRSEKLDMRIKIYDIRSFNCGKPKTKCHPELDEGQQPTANSQQPTTNNQKPIMRS